MDIIEFIKHFSNEESFEASWLKKAEEGIPPSHQAFPYFYPIFVSHLVYQN